jgi:hypothetical protein
MNMQARFDLETAEDLLAPQIKKIASYEAAAQTVNSASLNIFLLICLGNYARGGCDRFHRI